MLQHHLSGDAKCNKRLLDTGHSGYNKITSWLHYFGNIILCFKPKKTQQKIYKALHCFTFWKQFNPGIVMKTFSFLRPYIMHISLRPNLDNLVPSKKFSFLFSFKIVLMVKLMLLQVTQLVQVFILISRV